MPFFIPTSTLEKFTTFGDLLRFLRQRVGLTQIDLATAVGYSHSQISRLEQNLRLPDIPTIENRFVSALGLEDEPKAVARLLELAANVRREDAPALGLCPYKGLSYFDESDADLFVGREALTAKLMDRVLSLASYGAPPRVRFLAVVGASGSGKSSLVRAGVVSGLRWNKASTGWQVLVFTPTAHPLESLAAALTDESDSEAETRTLAEALGRDPRSLQSFARRKLESNDGSNLLLAVDQFEEVFALCRSAEERAAFIASLLTAAAEEDGPVVILLTLRADFYPHCADYPPLREALAHNQEYIGAMSLEELRRSIEEPARRGRWEFEPDLVDLLLRDVGQEPGALPLLSHALFETWQRRRGRSLTLSGYASSGGVRGAIAETADAVFNDQFTLEQQAIARRIFLRLTELGDETTTADTRRRATLSELILKPEEAEPTHIVIKALADARLITTGEDTAEVAHEALIREWPKLRGWLEENRDGLRLHHQLAEAAQEWLGAERSADLLYRGARLAQAREWQVIHAEEMNTLEGEFLAASTEASEREAQEREAQRQRELEAAQKLTATERARGEEQAQSAGRLRTRNRLITAVGALAILAAILAVIFGLQSNQNAAIAQNNAATAQASRENAIQAQATAQAERDRADESARLSFSRELAVQARLNLNVDTERSVLLALAAYKTAPTKEAADSLHEAVLASRVIMTLEGHTAPVYDIAFSPDEKHFASASLDNTVKVWDAAAGKELLTLTGHKDSVVAVAYSPDGTQLASASLDGSIKVWDAAAGRELFTISFGVQVTTVQFSPDGKWLIGGAAESRVRVWDAKSGQELFALASPDWTTQGLVVAATNLSPDGNRLAVSLGNQAGTDGKVEIWDLAARQRMLTLYEGSVYPSWSKQMSFSPDGTRFVFAGLGTTPIWEVSTGKKLYSLNAGVNTIVYSSDGRHLFSATGGGKAQVWDAATGEALLTLVGTDRIVETAAPNSDCVYNVPVDWCGTRLVTGGSDGSIKVWDITPQGRGEGPILPGIDFSLDGSWTRLTTLTTSQNKPGILTATFHGWTIPSLTQAGLSQLPEPEVLTLDGPLANYYRTTLTSSGQWLEFFPDGTIKIFDARSQGQAQLTVCCFDGIGGPNFGNIDTSQDGKLLAIINNKSTAVELWDLASRQKLKDLAVISDPNLTIGFIAFSPDGTRLATALSDNTLKVWDTATGQPVLALAAKGRNISSIAFSPDGRLVAAGNCQPNINIWDAATGQLKFKLTGHSACVGELAFSPDTTLLASSSPDKTTRIWDLQTGQEILTLPEGGIYSRLAFSPDGTRLASANVNGALKVYLVRMEDLVALAKSRLTRSLTPGECQQYLHVEQCPAGP